MTFNLGNIPTPCPQRAKIYEAYLKDVYDKLQILGSLRELLKMRRAFDDKSLLEKLAKILDEYVICGVAADLDRCRDQLEHKPQGIPDLSNLINTSGKNPIEKDKAKDAYNNYFDWYILPKKVEQNGKLMSGIEAFFARYPMIEHATKKSSTHFYENIKQACIRLAIDWQNIQSIFFSDTQALTITELVKINTTGSDFHKGGKQVLILTFETDQKLIYKPGDIELDYHLLANTNAIPSGQKLGFGLGNEKSIVELTNEFLDDDFKLPTYRIFPRNPGSQLKMADNKLPISDSYGYIEFLSNHPKVESAYKPEPKDWKPGQPSDWITENEEDVHKFYRQWGRFLAMGQLFSMSDFHLDNVIVHQLQPHLIDAEISFTGPLKDVGGTLALDSSIGALVMVGSPQNRKARMNKENANLRVFFEKPEQERKPSKNRLWLSTQESLNICNAYEHIEHLIVGYEETIDAYADIDNNNRLKRWLNRSNIKNAVARFTPMGTPDFSIMLRQLYAPSFISKTVPQQDDDYNRSPFVEIKKAVVDKYSKEIEDQFPELRPNYAIMHQKHVYEDLLNCDIPAFYHLLDSVDLLNSRGEAVKIQPPSEGTSIARDSYFPETTWNIVMNQIKTLDSQKKQRTRLSVDKMMTKMGVSRKKPSLWERLGDLLGG